jgi:hypothetical protein
MNLGTASAYPDNPVGMHTRTRRGRIDYVFYSGLQVRSARIPDSRDLSNTNVVVRLGTADDAGVRPSDHNAVIANSDANADPDANTKPDANSDSNSDPDIDDNASAAVGGSINKSGHGVAFHAFHSRSVFINFAAQPGLRQAHAHRAFLHQSRAADR